MVFGYDVKALQCDRCQAPDTFEHFGNVQNVSICRPIYTTTSSRLQSAMVLHGTRQVSYGDQRQTEGHTPESLDKFDHLTTLVESLLSKYPLLWRDKKPLSKNLRIPVSAVSLKSSN